MKLHLVLNHDGWLPQFTVVTPGRTADIELVRMLRFESGTLLVCDRSDPDSRWWMEPTRQGVFFITRFKNNAERGIVEQRLANRRRGIVQDEVMLLVRLREQELEALMRRIAVEAEEGGTVVFVIHHRELLAAVDRQR